MIERLEWREFEAESKDNAWKLHIQQKIQHNLVTGETLRKLHVAIINLPKEESF